MMESQFWCKQRCRMSSTNFCMTDQNLLIFVRFTQADFSSLSRSLQMTARRVVLDLFNTAADFYCQSSRGNLPATRDTSPKLLWFFCSMTSKPFTKIVSSSCVRSFCSYSLSRTEGASLLLTQGSKICLMKYFSHCLTNWITPRFIWVPSPLFIEASFQDISGIYSLKKGAKIKGKYLTN